MRYMSQIVLCIAQGELHYTYEAYFRWNELYFVNVENDVGRVRTNAEAQCFDMLPSAPSS
jgi:hypothetical protein